MSTHTSSTLNSLLRGELAATETYQQALEKVGNEPGADELRRIHDEHRESANLLRQHIREEGGQPQHDSGAWGTFAKTIAGAAKLFGDASALRALKAGEEHGLGDYEKAIDDARLPTECRDLVRTRLLPQTRSHVAALDRIIQMQ